MLQKFSYNCAIFTSASEDM